LDVAPARDIRALVRAAVPPAAVLFHPQGVVAGDFGPRLEIKMSMQIIEKSGEGLSRVYGVKVPASELGEKLDKRIAEIAPQLNLKGFRPGKVPQAHVRRLYGKSLMSEVIEQTLTETSQKVLDDNNLRVATQPDLTPESDMDKVMAGEADLAYELAVEVMPEFEPVDPKSLKLTRLVHQATDEEVAEALAQLADQNRTYATRTGKSVKAVDGDMVIVDFLGRVDGEAFEGGKAEDARIVLGSGQFIPGFEEQLVGAKPGGELVIKTTFPDDYPVDRLKGKAAEFEVAVKDVQAPEDQPLDDEFAKRLGMSDLAALKDALKVEADADHERTSRFKLKRALLDALDQGHDIPLPPRMVDAEFDVIWRQVEEDRQREGPAPEDEGKSEDDLKTEYRRIAQRRVRLGLVLAEIGRRNNVTVSDEELAQAMRAEAMRYRGQEQQIFDLLRQNPNAQAQLRAPVYEDKVVDLLFGLAEIEDKPVSKDVLLAPDEMPQGYGEAAEPAKPKAAKPKAAKEKAAKPKAEEAEEAEAPKAAAAKAAKPKSAKAAKAV
jgi:trigger factor